MTSELQPPLGAIFEKDPEEIELEKEIKKLIDGESTLKDVYRKYPIYHYTTVEERVFRRFEKVINKVFSSIKSLKVS